MIPHVTPPVWPESPPPPLGRLAAAILRNSIELLDDPHPEEAIGKCRIALLGMPDDTGVALNGGRPGAREAPNAFRAALARYGSAIPMAEAAAEMEGAQAGRGRPYPRVFDAGNIVPADDLEETHFRVTRAVEALLDLGLLPVGIGGGHDLTFPFVRAVAGRAAGPAGVGDAMAGVYLDAHLDVRAEAGSGMPFRRLVEECGVKSLTCIGADELAVSREHYEWFTEHNGRVISPLELSAFSFELSPPAFVSLDLDVLDAAFAPGVSAMNPCGLSPAQVAPVIRAAGRAPAVRCFDIMELSPPHDENGRTARVAARMFLEFLRGYAERPGGHPGVSGK